MHTLPMVAALLFWQDDKLTAFLELHAAIVAAVWRLRMAKIDQFGLWPQSVRTRFIVPSDGAFVIRRKISLPLVGIPYKIPGIFS